MNLILGQSVIRIGANILAHLVGWKQPLRRTHITHVQVRVTPLGTTLQRIFEALAVVSREVPVVVPMHPRTQAALQQEGTYGKTTDSICVIEPVGYLDMVMLEKNALLIATDSGGIQKEAFFHGVPCITLRDETEWTELVETGWNRIVSPTSCPAIVEAIESTLSSSGGSDTSPYGDGTAAAKTAQQIVELCKVVRD